MALPPTEWAKREALLRKGVAIDPAWPHTNGFLAQLLLETGRLRESTTYSAHAAAADLQIDWRPASAGMMCNAGVLDDTIDDLRKRLVDSPGDSNLQWQLYHCLLTAGRYEETRTVYPARLPPTPYVTEYGMVQRLIDAMISKSQADRGEARQQALALSQQPGPYHLGPAITTLSNLGYLDDAFAIAQQFRPGYPLTGTTSFFFIRSTAAMRHDPRFMPLMTKIGLVAFWRATGKWPDFCADPGLPYDCRREAERLARNS